MNKRKATLAEAFQGSLKRQVTSQDEKIAEVAQEESHEHVKPGSQQPIIEAGEVELVPGAKGKRVPADQPVNMTFTVTAKERYLWNLELSRRGITGVSVLREAMNALREGDYT